MRRPQRIIQPGRAAAAAVLGLAAALALGAIACCSPDREAENPNERETKVTHATSDGARGGGRNRLAREKSPYLLQHADNPVDWYPWGDDAFEAARREDKPIFLSIGYSTCHWCHVMEHESFEDSTVAALMNEAFINVKVDREERPDIDAVYMSVCQMVRGSGGWPLTVIMTPDAKPFFVATYLPRAGRQGMAGMLELVPHIRKIWAEQRNEVDGTASTLAASLAEVFARTPSAAGLGPELLDSAYADLSRRFDENRGGFGGAPKFPTPHTLLFLLRYWRRTGDARALEMVETTLQNMARGGIYDHVGGGFHRYSTDERWFAPHFEKMLYDQALLAMAYTECSLATRDGQYRRTAEETLGYVLRDMADSAGAFHSAEDADTEGIEGKYYLWTLADLSAALGEDDGSFAAVLFGADDRGNFAEVVPGANILHLRRPLEKTAEELGVAPEELRRRVDRVRGVLLEARGRRIRPHKDDKILADWNGLMIAALAKAARVYGASDYAAAAEKAARFVLESMTDAEGGLYHRYRDGEAAIPANLDDYAFVVWGLIELYETTFDAPHLEAAIRLSDEMIRLFADEKAGGFFFSREKGRETIVRTREIYDGAIPSGNSAAAMNLVRLSRLTGDPRYEERADRIGRCFHEDLARAPSGYAWFMSALDLATGPAVEVVIVGDPRASDTRAMIDEVRFAYAPHAAVLFKSSAEEAPAISRLAPFTAGQKAIGGRAAAYVCRNHACDAPTTNPSDVGAVLRRRY
jgi:uncharacterized protein YyaL (SSP411 family)